MSRKTTIRLAGDALDAAKAVHGIHQTIHAKKAELEREFNERMADLGREAQQQMSQAWAILMHFAELPMTELGQWELDASYLTEHGCAFLSKREREPEGEEVQASLGDLLQSMTAQKH